jgi:hypothetical protein
LADNNTLELINQISEFNDLHKFMEDDQLDTALALVVKLLLDPKIPASKAPTVIVQLQALSFKFKTSGIVYQTIRKGPTGSDSNHKKSIYYSVSEGIDRLVDALKYSARYGNEYTNG